MECLEYNAITSIPNDRSSIKSNTIAAHKSSETPIVIIDDDTESNSDDKEKQPNCKDDKKVTSIKR
ncbi:4689_t:CDS:2, partial [Racocetra fulgida]